MAWKFPGLPRLHVELVWPHVVNGANIKRFPNEYTKKELYDP